MFRLPLFRSAAFLTGILSLASCATVFQSPGDRSSLAYRKSAVRFETAFPLERFPSRLGRNLPGYVEPEPPSPEDLVIVESSQNTEDFFSLENWFAAGQRHHVAVFRGSFRTDGRERPLFVRADVYDRSGKVWDMRTNQEVQEPEFTRTDFAFLEARSGEEGIFTRPGNLDPEGVFPFFFMETGGWKVYLTTVLTTLKDPVEQARAVHNLWPNLKHPEQQFEIRDSQGRVVAWFDDQVFAVALVPTLDRRAVKALAASLLAFQRLARSYHRDDTVSVRVPPVPPEEYPIAFPPKTVP